MVKYNIVALFGKAGSGKDTILNLICQSHPEYNRKISCTSRAPREREVDGVDYHFISPLDFINKPEDFIEKENFNNWWYGTKFSDLKPAPAINIGVFNISGISQILNKSTELVQATDKRGTTLMVWNKRVVSILPIKITTSDKMRLIYQLSREESPNMQEIFRRYNADEKDFSNISFSYNTVYNEEGLIQDTVKNISKLINSYPGFFK